MSDAATGSIAELRTLGEHVDDLVDAAITLLGVEGIEALAVLLSEVRGVRQALGNTERAIEDLLTDTMFEDTITVTGVGTFQIRHGKTRKQYDSEELLRTVIRLALDPEGTGELPATIPEVVEAVRAAVYAAAPVTPSMQWRTTELRRIGLDPDEWCEAIPARTTIQITTGGES